MIPEISSAKIVGSANKERVIRLPKGTGFAQLSDASLRIPVEDTYGGAGLCNAVALRLTTRNSYGLNRIGLVSSVGADSQKRLDQHGREIYTFLQQRNINAFLQPQPGQSTEHTTVIVSGAQDEYRALIKDTENGSLARDRFTIDREVIRHISSGDMILASSFPARAVIDLAKSHKLSKPGGVFSWVLNGESIKGILRDGYVQKALAEGVVDIVFMSNSETSGIRRLNGHLNEVFKGVTLLVETLGKQGCRIIHNRGESSVGIETPAFSKIAVPVNDNGAGEAFHSNWLASIVAAKNRALFNNLKDVSPHIVSTAAGIGNLAGFISIQQPGSLDFPTLDYQIVGEMMEQMMRGNVDYTPNSIPKRVYSYMYK